MNGNEFRNAEHPARGGRTMSKSTVDEVMDLSRNLPLTRSVLRTTLQDAAPGRPGLLAGLLKAENASREQSRRLRPPEHAVFPPAKELDGCDWSMTGLPRDRGRNDLLTLGFIDRAEDLVLYGDVGTGKTHLAIALGRQACGNDIPVRFFTAAGLVMRPKEGQDGRPARPRAQGHRAGQPPGHR
ncbi:MAG: ATP-binding protein [Bifidobacterium sp.]|jgi:hypothetical protein